MPERIRGLCRGYHFKRGFADESCTSFSVTDQRCNLAKQGFITLGATEEGVPYFVMEKSPSISTEISTSGLSTSAQKSE
jgi:hypothetical protein